MIAPAAKLSISLFAIAKYAVSRVQQFSNSQALSDESHTPQSGYGPKSGKDAGPEPVAFVISQHVAPLENEKRTSPTE